MTETRAVNQRTEGKQNNGSGDQTQDRVKPERREQRIRNKCPDHQEFAVREVDNANHTNRYAYDPCARARRSRWTAAYDFFMA